MYDPEQYCRERGGRRRPSFANVCQSRFGDIARRERRGWRNSHLYIHPPFPNSIDIFCVAGLVPSGAVPCPAALCRPRPLAVGGWG